VDFVKGVANDIAGVATGAAQATGGLFQCTALLRLTLTAIGNIFGGIFTRTYTVTPLNNDVSLNTGTGSATSPWGKSYLLYNSQTVKAYCVGCGTSGKMHLTGTMSFSIAHGVTAGYIRAQGDAHAVLQLGIVATEVSKSVSFSQQIFGIPLQPYSIAGIFFIGPELSLSVGGGIGASAKGQLLTGVKLDWPGAYANLDLVDGSRSGASGWTPKVTPVFNVNGMVSVTGEAFLAIALEFGVDILNGKIKKTGALINKPKLTVGVATTKQGCSGVGVSVGVSDQVYFDVLGIKQYPLWTWIGPSAEKCIK
jgi:hypothetical protein